jgi:hypothetical protein
MTYDEIFSSFYPLITDNDFFRLDEDYAYNLMRKWLHSAISDPYIRKLFTFITLDDEIMVCDFQLENSVSEDDDKEFVLNVFSKYMVIQWMKPKIDNQINIARIIGGKEEKNIQNNYKENKDRLKSLELELRKFIRDYGTENNSYISGGS